MPVLRYGRLQLFQNIVGMAGAMPVTMETAAAGEEKDCSVAPIERLRRIRKIPEGCPGMPVRIGNRE